MQPNHNTTAPRLSVETSEQGLLLSEKADDYIIYDSPRKKQKKRSCITVTAVASLLLNIVLLSGIVAIHKQSRISCFRRYNAFSPFREAIEDEDFVVKKFDYSLWYPSPFKGPPNPQVEEAWNSIMANGVISASESQIRQMEYNTTESVRYPDHIGGGGYPIFSAGSHAIHCLHFVWQDHYIDQISNVSDMKNEIPELYERHYEHCVDYMRQYLMCKYDTTALAFNWVRDHQNPTPNGHTPYKCVNWDKIQSWMKNRAVQKPDGFTWSQPGDAISLEVDP